jgi:hypothetical protein
MKLLDVYDTAKEVTIYINADKIETIYRIGNETCINSSGNLTYTDEPLERVLAKLNRLSEVNNDRI